MSASNKLIFHFCTPRCVGYLDRKRGNFNCVSVRPVKQTELQAMMSFLQASQRTMQQQLAALKED